MEGYGLLQFFTKEKLDAHPARRNALEKGNGGGRDGSSRQGAISQPSRPGRVDRRAGYAVRIKSRPCGSSGTMMVKPCAESTAVPAFRKRNDWPSGSLRFIEAQNVPLRGGCHDHSQGVQRQIQFNLAHHAFPVRGCRVFVRAHRNFPEILCNVPPFQGCNMDIVAFEDLQRNAIFSLDMLEMRLSAPG